MALEAYERAMEIKPGDADCVFDYSLFLSKSGKLKDAITLAKRAVRLNPQSGKANALLADLIWRATGSIEQSKHFADRALACPDAVTDATVRFSAAVVGALATEQSPEPKNAVRYWEIVIASKVRNDPLGLLGKVRLASLCAFILGVDVTAQQALARIECTGEDVCGKSLLDLAKGEAAAAAAPAQQFVSIVCEAFISHYRVSDPGALTHKIRLFKALSSQQERVLPPSIVVKSKQECAGAAKSLHEVSAAAVPVYFLKDPAVQRGQGIAVIVNDDFDKCIPDDFFAASSAAEKLLQLGVAPPLLLDGHKFGIRVHALIVNCADSKKSALFVFGDGILTKCWDAYKSDSNDPLIHVSSTSVQRLVTGFDRSKVKGLASLMFPEFASTRERMCGKILKACVAVGRDVLFPETCRGSALPCFQCFGVDVLYDAHHEPFLAEFNASPQFQDAKKTSELYDGFALPMINGLPGVLAAVMATVPELQNDGQGNKRWIFVGEF